jgi:glutamate carboxypeptidase
MADRHPLLVRADGLREHALARLERLVSLESPSGERGLLAAVADELQAGYERAGARVQRDPGPDGDHLVCDWAGAAADGGHALLIGHYDTVLPAGSIDSRPFALAGDVLSGPGVFDMKGALVSVELALRLLADDGRALRRPVRLVIVNDEELGSPDGQRVVAAHALGAVAAIGLEPPLPGGRLKTGRRGVARVRLTVDGREAHAGLDQADGVSAIDELVDQLTGLRDLGGAPGVGLNVGTICGGTRANVVAGHAGAELGLRFADAAAERSAQERFDALRLVRRDAVVKTEWLSRRPAWAADPANPLAAEFVALAAGLGIELGTGTSGGAGDTNYTGAAGIPTVDGLGPEGKGAHGPAEEASLRSLLERAALLADYLGDQGDPDPTAQRGSGDFVPAQPDQPGD